MKLFKWGSKTDKKVLPKPSNVKYIPIIPDLLGGWLGGGINSVPVSQAFIYYQSVSPFYHAVNKIATEIATIRPIIRDNKRGIELSDHPLLKVLNNPNSNATYYEFAKRCITHLLVAGNLFLRVKALNENSPPIYVDAIDPRAVTLTQTTSVDQYAWQYNVVLTNDSETFLRDSSTVFLYYNQLRNQELCQIKDFCSTTDNLLGMPRTAPLYYDLEQFSMASRYNLAVLTNGGRLSTIFINKDTDITPEDLQRLQQENRDSLSGPSNSGRSVVLNGNWGVEELGVSNKDMDFLKQKEHVSQNIYSLYEIPLPLVMSSTMTMGNYENAVTTFYDNAVIPTLEFFFQRLSKFLLRRYKNSEDLEISYDPFSITALESRRLDQLERRVKLKVESPNEIRLQMNLDPLQEGGNSIYDNSSQIPIGSTEKMSDSERDALLNEKQNLSITQLKSFKYPDGKPIFSDSELEKLKAEYGI